ncbi:hypothetical protein K503DRAFT_83592 [Rhizopogon vinicolor AM-OR11-026]|uniref:Uncharacterized protein n=1 Tax=Rhizopogon vinicolor AM-OR11-026 TaxID=1314800 RepID=A0A1B7MFU1_9AGAM|nr:hypothetical protein K503DRAFT_83592 [Rhizopogon vinicolor AM-OR11-026]
MSITLMSSLVILSKTTPLPSSTAFPGRKTSHLALALPGRPVISRSISSPCTVLIEEVIIIRAPITPSIIQTNKQCINYPSHHTS